MSTHRFTTRPKDGAAPESACITEGRIIPFLRRRKRPAGEVASITAERSSAAADGYSEAKEDTADRRARYHEGLKSSVDVIVGIPMVGTFEASHLSFYKIAA
jgi:hypothetical protein